MNSAEYYALLAAQMSEVELERKVREVSQQLGIAAWHQHDSRNSEAGFPDFTLAGTGTLMRELKRQKPKVPPHQLAAHQILTRAGQDVAVWRPADWYSGRILRELQALAPPPDWPNLLPMLRPAHPGGRTRRNGPVFS